MKNNVTHTNNENENKITTSTILITTLICLIPVVIGAILYPNLPDEIVTHWGANGEPNGWSNKFTGVILFPGSLVLLNLIMAPLLKVDPRYKNMDMKVTALIQWIIPVVSVFASGSTLAYALGHEVKVQLIGQLFMGMLFIVLGNYMPKMRYSYTVGIKVPWTLADEEVWDKTHRMAGFLWVICGFIVFIGSFLRMPFPIMIAACFIMIAVPVLYSYLIYRKKQVKNTECRE